MKRNPMNIVIAVNRRYVRYSYFMLTSLLLNNPDPVDVYVLHCDLTAEDELISGFPRAILSLFTTAD